MVFLHHFTAVLDDWDPRVIDGIAAVANLKAALTLKDAAVCPGFDSYQKFTERRIPVAVLERGAA